MTLRETSKKILAAGYFSVGSTGLSTLSFYSMPKPITLFQLFPTPAFIVMPHRPSYKAGGERLTPPYTPNRAGLS